MVCSGIAWYHNSIAQQPLVVVVGYFGNIAQQPLVVVVGYVGLSFEHLQSLKKSASAAFWKTTHLCFRRSGFLGNTKNKKKPDSSLLYTWETIVLRHASHLTFDTLPNHWHSMLAIRPDALSLNMIFSDPQSNQDAYSAYSNTQPRHHHDSGSISRFCYVTNVP